jgi:hypothetical protein
LKIACKYYTLVWQTMKKYLLGRAPISNWLFLLMAVCILLMAVFFKIDMDSYNTVDKIVQDQQALIDTQQKIIERFAPPPAEAIHIYTSPY